jgi:2-iminobutanoate/2-iminopropanoate deaminase
MKEEIVTANRSKKPLSSGIKANGLVFVSGQGGLKDGEVVGPDIESQTLQTIENIRKVLEAAELGLDDIVKVHVYLSDRKFYDKFNEVYRSCFTPPYPSRTAVYCDLNYDLLVEMDAIAVTRQGGADETV